MSYEMITHEKGTETHSNYRNKIQLALALPTKTGPRKCVLSTQKITINFVLI